MAERAKRAAARRGTVGVKIYEEVERLTAGEHIGRTEALRRIAKKSGRNFGTVAANFYRVARQRGATFRARSRGAGTAGGARRRGVAAARSADVRRILAALSQAARLLRRQEAEIDRLMLENRRLTEIRRLVGRG